MTNFRNPVRRLRAALVCVGALLVLAGCAAGGGKMQTPPPTGESAEYRIGPGDQLQIYVWNSPELSITIPVRPDGRITTPLVADIMAAGRTPSQLATDMEEKLAEFIRQPKVNIIVLNFQGADQVKVVGQARNPRSIPFRAGMRLLDVMLEVGGLNDFAAGNRARVVRRSGNGTVEIPVRIKDLLNDGAMAANIEIMAGDVVIIPESRF